MKVVIYKASLPVKAQKSPEKMSGFTAFAAGAKRHGVSIAETDAGEAIRCDVGLVFSFVDLHQPDANLIPYMRVRKRIFNTSAGNLFFFENDVLKDYNNKLVMRFPFRSVYDHEAEYFLDHVPDERTDAAFKHIEADIKKGSRRRKSEDKVVITLNRLAGYGRCGVAQFEWAYNLIKDLRAKSPSRGITIRLHPGNVKNRGGINLTQVQTDKRFYKTIVNEYPEVKMYLPKRKTYLENLDGSAIHVFNSSSASCESILRGGKTVVTHPSAFSWNFSPHSLEDDTPSDPIGLLSKYKKTHFTKGEVESGLYWDYIKNGLKEVL